MNTILIDSDNYRATPLGASWIVRDKRRGEIIAFRPDEKSARELIDTLESGEVTIEREQA